MIYYSTEYCWNVSYQMGHSRAVRHVHVTQEEQWLAQCVIAAQDSVCAHQHVMEKTAANAEQVGMFGSEMDATVFDFSKKKFFPLSLQDFTFLQIRMCVWSVTAIPGGPCTASVKATLASAFVPIPLCAGGAVITVRRASLDSTLASEGSFDKLKKKIHIPTFSTYGLDCGFLRSMQGTQ